MKRLEENHKLFEGQLPEGEERELEQTKEIRSLMTQAFNTISAEELAAKKLAGAQCKKLSQMERNRLAMMYIEFRKESFDAIKLQRFYQLRKEGIRVSSAFLGMNKKR